MNKSILRRLMETLFRRWPLFLIPFLLIIGLGASTIAGSSSTYRSAGVLTINSNTLLSDLADVTIDAPFTYETPASFTSRRINDLMRSTGFAESVAEAAGLNGALLSGVVTLVDIRSSVSASPAGDSLVSVSAETNDPDLSFRLATATIDQFISTTIESDLRQSDSAARFYEDLAVSYETAVGLAGDELDTYVRENPAPAIGDLPPGDQNEIARLQAAEALAQEQMAEAVNKAEDARLVAEQTRLDIDQRIGVIDSPELPFGEEPRLKRSVLTAILFLGLGVIAVTSLVAAVTIADRSIRDENDVVERLGLPVIAAIPRAKKSSKRKRRGQAPAAEAA